MPVGLQRSIVGAALLTALAAPFASIGISSAEPRSPLHLEWAAPEGCPTASEIEEGVQRLLGAKPQVGAAGSLDVSASARQSAGGLWLGEVETRLGSKLGRRSIQAESCRALADATALIVALTLDPEAVAAHRGAVAPVATDTVAPLASSSRPAAGGAPPPGLAASTPVTPPAGRRAAEPPRHDGGASVSVWLAARSTLDLGTLPRAAFGGGLAAGIGWRRSTLGVGFDDFAKVSTTIAGTSPPAGGNFHLLTVWLAACPAVGTGAFDWGACARFELDSMSGIGTGSGVDLSYGNSFRWAAVGGGAQGRFHVNRGLSIPLELGLIVPLASPRFTLKGISENNGRVHQPAGVSGRVTLGLALAF